jgi:single-stranded-DNA-specific exonuclease
MAAAVERIEAARARDEHVLIFGDYDVDGIAGTAILCRALLRCGLARISYGMPNRLTEGYGLSPQRVEWARRQGATLLITVDNGINARDAAHAARQLGVDLIITDHHEIEGELPQAVAVVNPKREPACHPLADAAGATVAFKLASALTHAQDDLDLAALGTVADMVPLRGENRDLVAAGLACMATRPRTGLQKLAEVAGVRLAEVTAEDVAYYLAPRINAGGRMGDGLVGLKLLLTESPAEAAQLAGKLNEANDARRAVEQELLSEVMAELEQTFHSDRRSIVLGRHGWHPGVLGIVASRVQTAFYRPVVMIAFDEHGKGRGSARGIAGFDTVKALDACRSHLEHFGGHRAAAGLTIREDNLAAFRESFEEEALRQFPAEVPKRELVIDALVSLGEMDTRLISFIQRLQPFGNGNRPPVFCTFGVMPVANSYREINGGHVRFTVREGQRIFPAIGFRMADVNARVACSGTVDIAFTPRFATWRGETMIELHLQDMRPATPLA